MPQRVTGPQRPGRAWNRRSARWRPSRPLGDACAQIRPFWRAHGAPQGWARPLLHERASLKHLDQPTETKFSPSARMLVPLIPTSPVSEALGGSSPASPPSPSWR